VGRVLFRIFYGLLLVVVFLGGAWIAFRDAIVGRSVTVPDFVGKTVPEAIAAAHRLGLRVEEQAGRARSDEKIPRDRILSQQPDGGSLAKPAQVVKVVVSLGPRQLRVPELIGLPPRAASLRLTEQSLTLGTVSWYREEGERVGIVAQDPEPDTVVAKASSVAVLTNRGMPETRYVMPDLVGQDADRMKARLETFGFRVGSARYEVYEGIPANTVLKQFPPAGYPLTNREVVSLTVSRPAETFAPAGEE
jgi:serine/threonine-protein kinase